MTKLAFDATAGWPLFDAFQPPHEIEIRVAGFYEEVGRELDLVGRYRLGQAGGDKNHEFGFFPRPPTDSATPQGTLQAPASFIPAFSNPDEQNGAPVAKRGCGQRPQRGRSILFSHFLYI